MAVFHREPFTRRTCCIGWDRVHRWRELIICLQRRGGRNPIAFINVDTHTRSFVHGVTISDICSDVSAHTYTDANVNATTSERCATFGAHPHISTLRERDRDTYTPALTDIERYPLEPAAADGRTSGKRDSPPFDRRHAGTEHTPDSHINAHAHHQAKESYRCSVLL